MPVTTSFPGVYIEEIPSGVRTITGVATSITAFIGRALRGPTGEAVIVFSYGEFERTFGALTVDYPMGYSVRDFFLNGGGQALIVRLFHDPAADAAQAVADAAVGADAKAAAKAAADAAAQFTSQPEKDAAQAVATAASNAAKGTATAAAVQAAAQAAVPGARWTIGGFPLRAAYRGTWAASLRVTLDLDVSADVAQALGLTQGDLFNLTVRNTAAGGSSETFFNLTVKESARRVDRVLASGSNLLRWEGILDPNNPPPPDDKVTALRAAKKKLDDDLKAGKDPVTLQKDRDAVAAAQQPLTDVAPQHTPPDPLGPRDSGPLTDKDYFPDGGEVDKTGLFTLERTDLFNLLCIPADQRDGSTSVPVYQGALAYCRKRRAMLIVDPPADWSSANDITKDNDKKLTDLNLTGEQARNAALYFPRVLAADPNRGGQSATFVPCGIIAGVMARTDVSRGVWKAPAGLDASLNGVQGLAVDLTNDENGLLNPLGINCLRTFPVAGTVVWGARTLRGADLLADEYKYVPVRRLALFLEESLYRGTQWVVFEPNDEPLWAQIRLNIGAFMQNLFRQGAFQGKTPREAYFVKCDKETTTQNDVDLGRVNIVVGFAPLKPAEFVIIQIQQIAGQIAT